MLDWNDLRYFLAVARTGSTLAAGRTLRVSQTTAARRVTALEAALGLILFERRPTGYALTPAGEAHGDGLPDRSGRRPLRRRARRRLARSAARCG